MKTIYVNYLRSLCMVITISVITAFSSNPVIKSFTHLIVIPIIPLFFVAFFFIVKNIPVLGLIGSFMGMFGDPLMFVLHKFGIIPTRKYNIINFTSWISVVDDPSIQVDETDDIEQEWSAMARAIIENNSMKLPGGDIGELGRGLLENNVNKLPSGDLGKLGRALIEKNELLLPSGDLGGLGRAILENNELKLPSGSLGKVGRAIIENNSLKL